MVSKQDRLVKWCLEPQGAMQFHCHVNALHFSHAALFHSTWTIDEQSFDGDDTRVAVASARSAFDGNGAGAGTAAGAAFGAARSGE